MDGGVLKSLLRRKVVYIRSVAEYSICINNVLCNFKLLLII